MVQLQGPWSLLSLLEWKTGNLRGRIGISLICVLGRPPSCPVISRGKKEVRVLISYAIFPPNPRLHAATLPPFPRQRGLGSCLKGFILVTVWFVSSSQATWLVCANHRFVNSCSKNCVPHSLCLLMFGNDLWSLCS